MNKIFHSTAMVFIAAFLLLCTIVIVFQVAAGHGHHNHKAGVKHGDLTLMQPWVRIRGDHAKSGAGYIVIHNHGPADRLVAISSDIAKRNELHQMIDDNGIMKMRQYENGIIIPANDDVHLEPGGSHMMFMGLNHHSAARDAAQVTLTFERAGDIVLSAPINPIDQSHNHNDKHNH